MESSSVTEKPLQIAVTGRDENSRLLTPSQKSLKNLGVV